MLCQPGVSDECVVLKDVGQKLLLIVCDLNVLRSGVNKYKCNSMV